MTKSKTLINHSGSIYGDFMKVGSSTYTALAGMQKGMNNERKQTADLAGAAQMQGQVEKSSAHVATNSRPEKSTNEVIGTIIDVKA